MKILLKQFFKTFFKKNVFLIVGLGALVSVLSFVVSTSINISQSFNQSLNTLNNESSKAEVVSKIPTNFGSLSFSISSPKNNEKVQTYVSNLFIQKDSAGKINRAKNTIFPYTHEELASRINTEINKCIEINPNYTSLENMFNFVNLSTNKLNAWDFNYGLSVLGTGRNSYNDKTAIAISFVDNQNQILINPQQILFNKQGLPFAVFQNGNVSNEYNFCQKFLDLKKGTKTPIYDQKGFGIPQNIFNRTQSLSLGIIHDETTPLTINIADAWSWNTNQNYVTDVFSKFITLKEVTPIYIDFDFNNSFGPIKTFLQANSDLIPIIFNNIFPIENIQRRPDDPISKNLSTSPNLRSNISLKFNEQNQSWQIVLALSDDIFVNPSSKLKGNELIQETQNNKRLYLNNFISYLNNQFLKEFEKIFNSDFFEYLNSNDINVTKQSEYYYLNPTENKEYLFIDKNGSDINKIYITEGSDISYQNDSNLSELKLNLTTNDGYRSIDTFYALKNIIDMAPSDALPKEPKKAGKLTESQFYLYRLSQYCLNQIINQYESLNTNNKQIPIEIYDSPYFKLICKLLNIKMSFNINTNQITSEFVFENNFTTFWSVTNVTYPYFFNYYCVLNDAFAHENKKKYLPLAMNNEDKELWINKINQYNSSSLKDEEKKSEFINWIDSISNTSTMLLSKSFIDDIFKDNSVLFNIWLSKLSNDYKISYNETCFLVTGFGASADYAYPVMSPTNPIPTPENQALVYVNNSTFNSLNISSVNISSYYTFYSNSKSNSEIIDYIKTYCQNNLNQDIFKPELLSNAKNLGPVFIRSYFPDEIRNLLIVVSVISSVVLTLLSLVVIYLLLNSFIKNLLESISLTMANGISLKKIITAACLNLGILTIIANMIGYIAAYFSQTAIINLFSSIWMVPGTAALGFTPLIFLPLLLLTFLTFGGILSYLLYRKFKKPIPEIIANKNDIKNNKLTNFIRSSKLKIPVMSKLAIGFTSVNIGRLSLLALLGSFSLGFIVSGITINDKFIQSQNNTIDSRNFTYEYDLINVNESTGLYKPQKFWQLGYEDKTVGINSLYKDKAEHTKDDAPYYKEMFQLREIDKNNKNKTVVKTDWEDGTTGVRYLSNMIYPSWYIYQLINSKSAESFFNGCASVFLLDVSFNLFGQNINVWEFIKPNFPNWLVSQLSDQAQDFQNAIMKYYGEWYYQFIKLDSAIIKNNITNKPLYINKFNNEDCGMYIAYSKTKTGYKITKPYYLWESDINGNSFQKYESNKNNIKESKSVALDSNISLSYDRKIDFYTKKKNKWVQEALQKNDKVNWAFIPAFNNYHILDPKTSAKQTTDPTQIRYSDKFIEFISTIYADKIVSEQDSKISFGIIPFDNETDEQFTLVNANIMSLVDTFGNKYTPKNSNVKIYGIKPNSTHIKLKSNDKDINHLLNTPSTSKDIIYNPNKPVNVIINNGSSLEYGLDVGDTFDINVQNSSLNQSYRLMSNIVGNFNNPINTHFKFKVVGVCDDSFGNMFYMNQEDANNILGLSKMKVYTKLSPNIQTENPSFVPFNGIYTSNPELLISRKSIPFYTFSNIWNTITIMRQNNPNVLPTNKFLDLLLTYDPKMLIEVAKKINKQYDQNIDINLPSDQLRQSILDFLVKSFSFSSCMQSIDAINQETSLTPSLIGANSLEITNKMFNIISTLSTTIIISTVAVAIPLLLLVCLVTSLSMINDLSKNIGLMKIMGYSNRNIILVIAMMFIPVIVITLLLGLGIMFALTYGLQYLVFNLTSIFITPYVSAPVYFIGVAIVLVILGLSLSLIGYILKRRSLEYSIKF